MSNSTLCMFPSFKILRNIQAPEFVTDVKVRVVAFVLLQANTVAFPTSISLSSKEISSLLDLRLLCNYSQVNKKRCATWKQNAFHELTESSSSPSSSSPNSGFVFTADFAFADFDFFELENNRLSSSSSSEASSIPAKSDLRAMTKSKTYRLSTV